jgi:hypothetical protein
VTPQRACSWAIGVGFALACACDGAGPGSGRKARDARGGSSVGGQVVSTVDGAPITVGDVRALTSSGEIAPRAALRRLQEERLLAKEAARRGMAQEWAVSEVGRKAAVQALLATVAEEAVVADAELQAAYTAQRERFEKPELRAAIHLLGRAKADAGPAVAAAARAAVERLTPVLANAVDIDGFAHAYRKVTVDGVEIICERLPPFQRVGKLEQTFADAMFSIPGTGMVPGATKTSYGWHVIRVLEVVPAETTPMPVALATLREELLTERRKQRVTELLARLAKAYPVQLSGDATQSLATLSF